MPYHRVKILELAYLTIDSNTIMFVYAAAMAFCDALGIDIEIPIKVNSDSKARYFCFPF